ncbi:MAG: DUF2975 domain-containing protein [Lachnospiraceae bacterium]|nr:DUF2975 domain-containing protein [Lachnospiraceae bacterium]
MKEKAIQKINKVGKISYIITTIAKVLVIVSLICTLVAAVFCAVIPEEAVKMSLGGNLNVEIDYASLGGNISEEERANLEAILEEEQDIKVQNIQVGMIDGAWGITVADQNYQPTDIVVTEDIVQMALVSEDVMYTFQDLVSLWLLAAVALAMTLVTLCFIGALCKAFRNCTTPFDGDVIKKMQNLAISLIPWTIVSSLVTSVLESAMSGGIHLIFSIDLGVVLVVLIVLVLVSIFKYGAVLQQESDETL